MTLNAEGRGTEVGKQVWKKLRVRQVQVQSCHLVGQEVRRTCNINEWHFSFSVEMEIECTSSGNQIVSRCTLKATEPCVYGGWQSSGEPTAGSEPAVGLLFSGGDLPAVCLQCSTPYLTAGGRAPTS